MYLDPLRHFKTLSQQRFYQLTARLHAQITCGGNTVCFNVQGSPIIPGFLSAQWLRCARPLGLIGRVQGRPGNKFPALNVGTWAPHAGIPVVELSNVRHAVLRGSQVAAQAEVLFRVIGKETVGIVFDATLPRDLKPLVQIGQNVSESTVVSNIRPTRISDTAEAE